MKYNQNTHCHFLVEFTPNDRKVLKVPRKIITKE